MNKFIAGLLLGIGLVTANQPFGAVILVGGCLILMIDLCFED